MDFATIFVLIYGVMTGTYIIIFVYYLLFEMDEPKVVPPPKPKQIIKNAPLQPIGPVKSRIKNAPRL